MSLILKLAFLFAVGCVIGWIIEVIFRKFFSGSNPFHKWINPGFLTGPALPLYGNGLCILYLLASLEGKFNFSGGMAEKLLLFALMALCATLLEYITGYLMYKLMHLRLWDYSRQWGNIDGFICPLFTLFWAALAAAYYFLIHPHILQALDWLSMNLAFSFFIGMFYGIFIIDFAYSAGLIAKIRAFAKEKDIVVAVEDFRKHLGDIREKSMLKRRFILSLHSQEPIKTALEGYVMQLKKNGVFDERNDS